MLQHRRLSHPRTDQVVPAQRSARGVARLPGLEARSQAEAGIRAVLSARSAAGGPVIQRRKLDIPNLGEIDTRRYTFDGLTRIIGAFLSGVTPQGQKVSNYELMQAIFAAIDAGEVMADRQAPPSSSDNDSDDSSDSDGSGDSAAATPSAAAKKPTAVPSKLAKAKARKAKQPAASVSSSWRSTLSDSDEQDEKATKAPAASPATGGGATFHHFATGAAKTVKFTGGALGDGKKKLSKNDRRDAMGELGVGEHVTKGHVDVSAATLRSQASLGKGGPGGNFSWASDEALLAAVALGRAAFAAADGGGGAALAAAAPRERDVVVALPDGAGFGVVKANDGKFYKVWPKTAKIVRMALGDLKTAYGVTTEKNVQAFADAYHRWEAM